MFFKGCQIVVVWRTSQWNLCKIRFTGSGFWAPNEQNEFSRILTKEHVIWENSLQHVSLLIKGYRWAKNEPKMSEIRILNLCHKKAILIDIYRQSLLKWFVTFSGCFGFSSKNLRGLIRNFIRSLEDFPFVHVVSSYFF